MSVFDDAVAILDAALRAHGGAANGFKWRVGTAFMQHVRQEAAEGRHLADPPKFHANRLVSMGAVFQGFTNEVEPKPTGPKYGYVPTSGPKQPQYVKSEIGEFLCGFPVIVDEALPASEAFLDIQVGNIQIPGAA